MFVQYSSKHNHDAAASLITQQRIQVGGRRWSGPAEAADAHVRPRGLRQELHQVKSLKGSLEDAHRREAVHLLVEGLRLEVCTLRRADETHSEAHRRQAIPVQALRQGFL